jgi:hypothetical protein
VAGVGTAAGERVGVAAKVSAGAGAVRALRVVDAVFVTRSARMTNSSSPVMAGRKMRFIACPEYAVAK